MRNTETDPGTMLYLRWMDLFVAVVNGFLQFTIVTKRSILDATGFLGLSLDWVPLKKA